MKIVKISLLAYILSLIFILTCGRIKDTSDETEPAATSTETNPEAEILAIPSLTVLALPSAYNDAAVPSLLLKKSKEDVGGAANFLGLPKMFVGIAETLTSDLLGGILTNFSEAFDIILPDHPLAPGENLLIKISDSTDATAPDYVLVTYNEAGSAFSYNLKLYWDNAQGEHCPAIDFSFNVNESNALTNAQVYIYPYEGPADDPTAPKKVLAEFNNNDPRSITMTMTDANQTDSAGPDKIKIMVTETAAHTIETYGGLYVSNISTSTSGFNPFGAEAVYSFAAIIDSEQNIAKQNMALSEALTEVDENFWDTYPISKAFGDGFIKYARAGTGEINCTTLGYALKGGTLGLPTVSGNESVPVNVCSTNTDFTDTQMGVALENYINAICASSSSGLCALKYVYSMDNAQCLNEDGFYGAGAVCSTDSPFSDLTLDIDPFVPNDIKNLSLPDIQCESDIGDVDVTYP